MNLSFDFSASAGTDPCRRTLEQARRLLDCYRLAVGGELPDKFVALQGLTRLLAEEEGGRLSADGRAYLARLADQVQAIDGLIRALANLGQLAGRPAPAGRVSLAEVVREAAAEAKRLSGTAGVEYRFQDILPVVSVPRPALYQALFQLLRNAAAAAVAGRPLCVEVGAMERADGVEVWVDDNGRGIPEERRHNLFTPFARWTPDSGHNGLGLFLVRQAVASWGGGLRLQSAVGEGTRVALSIPSATQLASPPHTALDPAVELAPG
jgi:signal transduction histidine kinase